MTGHARREASWARAKFHRGARVRFDRVSRGMTLDAFSLGCSAGGDADRRARQSVIWARLADSTSATSTTGRFYSSSSRFGDVPM